MDVAQRGARNLQRYKINGGSEFPALKIVPRKLRKYKREFQPTSCLYLLMVDGRTSR